MSESKDQTLPMTMKQKIFIVFLSIILSAHSAWAKTEKYSFNQEHSSLKGSITYSLIGTYQPEFQEFEGALNFDEENIKNSSVSMKIKTASIHSKYPVLDRIVRSTRLLNAQEYPYITFNSKSIRREKSSYVVSGTVKLRDVTKDFTFVFNFENPAMEGKKKVLKAKGQWTINRKDFDIIWNEWLDHGGIIVGDDINVVWEIKAFKE
ncbi:MAG: YceI family protein [Candidatus Omnitrophica bacterium]|nr:YceI family protein [Candidatus Omnitrophota bacterium]